MDPVRRSEADSVMKYTVSVLGIEWETTERDSMKSFIEGVLVGRGENVDFIDEVVHTMLGFVDAHGNYGGLAITITRKG